MYRSQFMIVARGVIRRLYASGSIHCAIMVSFGIADPVAVVRGFDFLAERLERDAEK